ncbi:MAG: bifunctional (p)ppGpp synthetase/guanosine-3',5'-bis(diphosphate) 3'-pyrophosphohydrolase, partial [Calditrichaeota bacterium]
TKISELKFNSVEQRQAENFRKMILSMTKDIRVILIKFADRLHNMRTLEFLPEKKRRRIALETRDVYAPLAHRLGIGKIKWELEDLSLKALEPEIYWNLVQKVANKREEREAYIRKFTQPIRRELKKAGIKAKITGRPKHLYSIFQKMSRRAKSFEEIYDLLAIRIIVKRVEECYYALGIVHSLFTPVQKRFKDYIATPKSNMYQSLHTTVIGMEGKMVEIQIRTDEMHRTAEEGIAAHWRYKEGRGKEDDLDKHLSWLRQILEWQQEINDPQEFMENLRIDLFQDEVFVFSPKGDLFKLPLGSTPVDFAFTVHTDIGLHCIGAKVNGKIVPLDYKLKSGDSVEIITSASQKPNPDWIKFTRTSKARNKIKRWLRDSLYEQSLKLGEEIFNKQLKRYHINKDQIQLKELALTFGLEDANQLFAAIGRGDISIQSVINKISPEKNLLPKDESILKKFISRARGSAKGVRVQGLDNLLFSFAKCCQPVPGDRILGFITRGRGVIIHRADCKNIVKLMEAPERHIDVEWDVEKDRHFVVRLYMLGEDRKNFLRDISESIAQTDTNIVSINMKAEDSIVHSNIIVEVKNLQHLTKVINKISKVKGVITVERLSASGNSPGD